MTFSSNAFSQLRYIKETVKGVTPVTGNAVNLRQIGQSFKATPAVIKSEEIRQDRLATGSTRTDLAVDGGFEFELSGREYDPFLCGLLGQTGFTHYGTAGLGTVFSMTAISTKFTAAVAPTGSSAFTTLTAGSWFKVVAPVGASASQKAYYADAWFKVSSVTAPTTTDITLDPSTPVAAAGLLTAIAGFAISASSIINGATFDTFTMEYHLSDIGQFLPYTGMQVGSMDLSLDVGAIVKGSFGFMGQGHNGMVGATTLPGSPVASQALDVMNSVADVGALFENGSNLLGGTTSFIKSVKFNVNNNPRGQKAVGIFGNAGVALGELGLSGTLELYVENATYYNRWLTGTNTSLALGVADAAGNGYMIDFGKVTFKDGGINAKGRDDVMLSLPFDAFYDAGTNRGIRITRAIAA